MGQIRRALARQNFLVINHVCNTNSAVVCSKVIEATFRAVFADSKLFIPDLFTWACSTLTVYENWEVPWALLANFQTVIPTFKLSARKTLCSIKVGGCERAMAFSCFLAID